jgi:Holliday junction resolvase
VTRTNYQRGKETEDKAREALRQDGYRVLRAAASAGDFDLIAYNAQFGRYISVKRTKRERDARYTRGKEAERLAAIDVPPFSTRELWIWLDHKGWFCREVLNAPQ